MKKLINDVQDVLDEQLAGLAKAHPSLTLHQDPVYVTRSDAPVAGKVALLSGGGSGHEPMHCGYIGQGMLSGACPGEIFTSPTPDKIFECAMQIDGGEGVLLIIKNYTGDILNFETATELLHDSGVKVTTVVIDDDVAVKDSLYTAGRRGVANTVLIEKLVGAAAERGDSLDACAELGRKLNNQGHSISVPVPFLPRANLLLPWRTMRWSLASAFMVSQVLTAVPSLPLIKPSMKCSTPCWKMAHTIALCVSGIINKAAGRKNHKLNNRSSLAIG